MKLIYTNSSTFNGAEHSITASGLQLYKFTKALTEEFEATLSILEENIRQKSTEGEDLEVEEVQMDIGEDCDVYESG
jgi:hypothetical protein